MTLKVSNKSFENFVNAYSTVELVEQVIVDGRCVSYFKKGVEYTGFEGIVWRIKNVFQWIRGCFNPSISLSLGDWFKGREVRLRLVLEEGTDGLDDKDKIAILQRFHFISERRGGFIQHILNGTPVKQIPGFETYPREKARIKLWDVFRTSLLTVPFHEKIRLIHAFVDAVSGISGFFESVDFGDYKMDVAKEVLHSAEDQSVEVTLDDIKQLLIFELTVQEFSNSKYWKGVLPKYFKDLPLEILQNFVCEVMQSVKDCKVFKKSIIVLVKAICKKGIPLDQCFDHSELFALCKEKLNEHILVNLSGDKKVAFEKILKNQNSNEERREALKAYLKEGIFFEEHLEAVLNSYVEDSRFESEIFVDEEMYAILCKMPVELDEEYLDNKRIVLPIAHYQFKNQKLTTFHSLQRVFSAYDVYDAINPSVEAFANVLNAEWKARDENQENWERVVEENFYKAFRDLQFLEKTWLLLDESLREAWEVFAFVNHPKLFETPPERVQWPEEFARAIISLLEASKNIEPRKLRTKMQSWIEKYVPESMRSHPLFIRELVLKDPRWMNFLVDQYLDLPEDLKNRFLFSFIDEIHEFQDKWAELKRVLMPGLLPEGLGSDQCDYTTIFKGFDEEKRVKHFEAFVLAEPWNIGEYLAMCSIEFEEKEQVFEEVEQKARELLRENPEFAYYLDNDFQRTFLTPEFFH